MRASPSTRGHRQGRSNSTGTQIFLSGRAPVSKCCPLPLVCGGVRPAISTLPADIIIELVQCRIPAAFLDFYRQQPHTSITHERPVLFPYISVSFVAGMSEPLFREVGRIVLQEVPNVYSIPKADWIVRRPDSLRARCNSAI